MINTMSHDAIKPVFENCDPQWRRPACSSARSDQSLFIRLLEIITSKRATSKILIFQLVSVAERAGLGMACLETPKTGSPYMVDTANTALESRLKSRQFAVFRASLILRPC